MNVVRNDWWVTPLWEVQTDYDEKFNNELLIEINRYYKSTGANQKDSNIWCCNTTRINQFREDILRIVKELTYDYIKPNYNEFDYYPTRGWLNYLLPGQHLPLHCHGGSKISLTYYVNAPDNSGDLMLIDPRGGVDWEKGEDGISGTKFNRITPTAGKLVFFPSYVLHSVDVNKSKEPRISITTDISTLSSADIEYFKNMMKG